MSEKETNAPIEDESTIEPLLLHLDRQERYELATRLKDKGWKPKSLREEAIFAVALDD